jgi:predicted Zn-dependent protease
VETNKLARNRQSIIRDVPSAVRSHPDHPQRAPDVKYRADRLRSFDDYESPDAEAATGVDRKSLETLASAWSKEADAKHKG